MSNQRASALAHCLVALCMLAACDAGGDIPEGSSGAVDTAGDQADTGGSSSDGSTYLCEYSFWKCQSNGDCVNPCLAQYAPRSLKKATWCTATGFCEVAPVCKIADRCSAVLDEDAEYVFGPASLMRCEEKAAVTSDPDKSPTAHICAQACGSDADCDVWSALGGRFRGCRSFASRVFVSQGGSGEPVVGAKYARCVGTCLSWDWSEVDFEPARFIDVPCTPGAITILEEPTTPTAGR
jgi:hypothetical protein